MTERGFQASFASSRKREVFVISKRNDGRSCHTLLSPFPSYQQSIQPINPVHDTADQQHLLRTTSGVASAIRDVPVVLLAMMFL